MLARIKQFLGLEAKPAKKPEEAKPIASEEEVEKVAEEKPKPKIGYVHLSGCTGDVMSLSENYEILAPLLTEMVDIVYGQTLVDAWWGNENNPNATERMPEMDLVLVEGSVCLQDEHSIKELKEARERAGLVVAFGSCAATGCFTRYSRGGQQAQPSHESFVPIADLVKVDCSIPGCPPSPEIIAKTVVAVLNGDMDYLQPMMDLVGYTEACGCDLQLKVVNQALCIGCGTCAMSCPTRAVGMTGGRPEVNGDRCVKCGICYIQCPRSWWPMDRIKKDTGL